MSKGDRGAVFAVGLVVGVAVALIFFVWAFPWFGDPPHGVGYYNSGNDQGAYQCCNQDDPHFWVRPFYGWLYAEDTLAQWTMAAFSIIATLVSVFAVILVRDTLLETRRIGEAQTRAYLGVENMIFSPADHQARAKPEISFDLKNFGQSTARYVTATTVTRYKGVSKIDTIRHDFGLIAPSHSPKGILDVGRHTGDILETTLFVVIEYTDIFDVKWRQEAEYYIFQDPIDGDGKRRMYVLPNTATEERQS